MKFLELDSFLEVFQIMYSIVSKLPERECKQVLIDENRGCTIPCVLIRQQINLSGCYRSIGKDWIADVEYSIVYKTL